MHDMDSQLVHDGVPGVAVGPVQVADVAVVGRPDQSEVSIAAPPIRGEYCGSTNQRRLLRLHQSEASIAAPPTTAHLTILE